MDTEDTSWLANSSFPGNLPVPLIVQPGVRHVDRSALLQAAASVLPSSSEESDDVNSTDVDSNQAQKSRKRDRSERKRKKHRHRDSPSKGSHKRKRHTSDYEKIQHLERQAAVMGAGNLGLPRGKGTTPGVVSTEDVLYLDTQGDAHNAMYESLYAGNLPRYSRLDPLSLVQDRRNQYSWQQQQQRDADTGQSKTDRYFLAQHALKERSKRIKRIHLAELRPASAAKPQPPQQQQLTGQQQVTEHSRKISFPAPAYIPLLPEQPSSQAGGQQPQLHGLMVPVTSALQAAHSSARGPSSSAAAAAVDWLLQEQGETFEENLLRRTREWNVATREHPESEQVWLDFANFQDEAARLLHRK